MSKVDSEGRRPPHAGYLRYGADESHFKRKYPFL